MASFESTTGARRATTSWRTSWASSGACSTSGSPSIATTTIGPLERALDAGAEPTALCGEVPIVPSTLVEEREVRAAVRAEIDKLPEREKLVLSLYYDDGLTLAQISTRPRRQREQGAADPHEVGAVPADPHGGGRRRLSDARPQFPRRTEEVRMRPRRPRSPRAPGAFIADTAVTVGVALALLVAAPPAPASARSCLAPPVVAPVVDPSRPRRARGVPATAGSRSPSRPAPSYERWRRGSSRSAGSSSTCATSSCATVTGCGRRTAGWRRRGWRRVTGRRRGRGRPRRRRPLRRAALGPDRYIDPEPLIGALVVPPLPRSHRRHAGAPAAHAGAALRAVSGASRPDGGSAPGQCPVGQVRKVS